MTSSPRIKPSLGLFIIFTLMLWGLLIHPLLASYADNSSLEAQKSSRLLQGYKRAIAQQKLNADALPELNAKMPDTRGIKARDRAQAEAQLQLNLKSLIQSVGGTVTSSQNVENASTEISPIIRTQIDLTLPASSLGEFLSLLSSKKPDLHVHTISLQPALDGLNANGTPSKLIIRAEIDAVFIAEGL